MSGGCSSRDDRKRFLLMHLKTCTDGTICTYPGCSPLKALINHCRNCNTIECRVCFRARVGKNKRKQSSPPGSGSMFVVTKELNSKRSKIDHVPVVCPVKGSMGANNTLMRMPKKPEVVSLIELFTPEQVREHITTLKQWVGQSKPKTGKNQAMFGDPCQLCGVVKLNFEPVPIYCTPCGARIKRNAKYYTSQTVGSKQHICNCCYNQNPGDSILVNGSPCPKAGFENQKNDKVTEEGWVQCDKCQAWQHQICALFNNRKNEGGQAKFTCPYCHIAEVERGECTPLQQCAVLGAKDLPGTSLGDHLEQRLSKKLKQERVNRARVQGKTYDEVPGADCLVVRVVSSVDKKLEVKKRFFETLKEVNYPNEFAYKSKVVLLFQKIDGVEVCLFAMIVQEFGVNCQQPNHRCVYLSYMDSVKYFQPDIKAVTGEDLRTFVYHEILIGYLEHCKKRGFTSCYIWACPPIKGDDYIFYCHPDIQKTPKSDKLREWYKTMLEKAAKEDIVVEFTNLYDHFFISGGSSGECRAKVTAARIPYFDGNYFPGAAEDFIYQLQQEEGGILKEKTTINKKNAKKALTECDQADLPGNASKDVLLMHKLREAISPKKEDFIMVHLQNSCSHCCTLITSGNFWGCCQCKNFKLCDDCYEVEHKLEKSDRHPQNNKREVHILYPVEVSSVPADPQDKDEILEAKLFDTRLTFLGLCEGNQYQFDTLRRAKHSSMMLLYHLHNPNVPAFVPVCHVCHLNIETGQGWHCEMCPDYNVCTACYRKDRESNHSHRLTQRLSTVDVDAQNEEATQQKVAHLRKVLNLLLHTVQCQGCPDPGCDKMKRLIQHGARCKMREIGPCFQCKRMWYLFKEHAASCESSLCHVPCCKDLQERMRKNKEQADSQGLAAKPEKRMR